MSTISKNTPSTYLITPPPDPLYRDEEGNPKAVKVPDVMVILGVPNHERWVFQTWVEGTVPNVIVEEVSSRKTRRNDLREKRELYAWLGVAEYFLFDTLGDCLPQPL